MTDTSLTVLLDVLIPGDDAFPRPGELDLAGALAAHPRFNAMASAMAAQLPADFAEQSLAGRTEAVRRIEREAPAVFDPFMVALYSLYYVHPTVLAAVERTSGYAARAPQPEGYSLKPFDPSIVAIPAARGPQYRDAGTGGAA